MDTKHTPTPWKHKFVAGAFRITQADDNSINQRAICTVHMDSREGEPIKFAPHDAEHIVRCVNAHDELVAALEEFEIEECHRCYGSGTEPEDKNDACYRCGGVGEIIKGGWPTNVRAALAKARGE